MSTILRINDVALRLDSGDDVDTAHEAGELSHINNSHYTNYIQILDHAQQIRENILLHGPCGEISLPIIQNIM